MIQLSRSLLLRDQLVDEPLNWPVIDARVLAEGHIGTFVEDQVRTPDGETMKREYLHNPARWASLRSTTPTGWRWSGSTGTPFGTG